jgi:hypothetical protein
LWMRWWTFGFWRHGVSSRYTSIALWSAVEIFSFGNLVSVLWWLMRCAGDCSWDRLCFTEFIIIGISYFDISICFTWFSLLLIFLPQQYWS